MQQLDNIRIVLVETTHPGNIGAAARAMKTMGLRHLRLVKPLRYPNVEATAMASGADDVLYFADVLESYEQALQDCRLVIGASARRRGLSCPELSPREAAAQLLGVAGQAPAALVFGRESSGLSNAELDHCHFMVHIPANPEYSSLNVAAAVQVLAYELRVTALADAAVAGSTSTELPHLPASAQEMDLFYQHLEQVLLDSGFLNPANPRHLMRRLRRLFNRAQPDQNEVNILRGILSSVQNKART
ncbi:MAG: tRNA (cytosine(32)/uridine(32)-2'-O)-methyltransferase TrmJ [Candidatus Competibacteraceae bacterium]|jgi:TrmH family RNA methyltransferase|nr:tRNA (cytosine(32)/uridine(32)-2'-O)-methyltransferase TrmJ [Candidatus Competibacteraceae bacterium]MCB1814651.1 tRNA (cytosine(32)/uridine(32)-2'-O)-methyltransferase TrmJ [Candidatus Competibacteraceae bacterium]